MNAATPLDQLFERRMEFPDPDARARFDRLVGMDEFKARITKLLGILVNPTGLEAWAERHRVSDRHLLDVVTRRPPLVVFAGDVGCGKTELAETIADPVARQERIDIVLFPMSLAARGQGHVGEMTRLISAAFDTTIDSAKRQKGAAKSRGATILLVDEADAVVQSREATQMHHEDRAGVNAFIRGVDRISHAQIPAAVILCTNRPAAIDPAVRRRAAEILVFTRPNDDQRRHVLANALSGVGFRPADIDKLVQATGPRSTEGIGFSYSDLTQRLLPALVLDAYPDRSLEAGRALQIARDIQPTTPFKEESQR
jgi:AAA+ superfamily predicted ATPase